MSDQVCLVDSIPRILEQLVLLLFGQFVSVFLCNLMLVAEEFHWLENLLIIDEFIRLACGTDRCFRVSVRVRVRIRARAREEY